MIDSKKQNKVRGKSITRQLRDEIEPFIQSCKSSVTQKNYRKWLTAFIRYCREHHNCKTHAECSEHIQDYSDYLQSKYSASTIHNYLAAVCSYSSTQCRFSKSCFAVLCFKLVNCLFDCSHSRSYAHSLTPFSSAIIALIFAFSSELNSLRSFRLKLPSFIPSFSAICHSLTPAFFASFLISVLFIKSPFQICC